MKFSHLHALISYGEFTLAKRECVAKVETAIGIRIREGCQELLFGLLSWSEVTRSILFEYPLLFPVTLDLRLDVLKGANLEGSFAFRHGYNLGEEIAVGAHVEMSHLSSYIWLNTAKIFYKSIMKSTKMFLTQIIAVVSLDTPHSVVVFSIFEKWFDQLNG